MGEVTHAGTGLASTSDNMISLSVPEISGNEWKYLKECLDTGWVSSAGPFVDRFEREVATYLGARHAVATVNGTAALHVALLATGIGADDEVLLPSLTFIAPANAIRYAGAWPVFMDVEPLHWQMDPEKTVHFLEKCCRWRGGALYNAVSGRRVKAILPIHLLGHPVDADPIVEVARRYNLIVVEDATESLGAKYKDVFVGCLGDLACFSFFHPNLANLRELLAELRSEAAWHVLNDDNRTRKFARERGNELHQRGRAARRCRNDDEWKLLIRT